MAGRQLEKSKIEEKVVPVQQEERLDIHVEELPTEQEVSTDIQSEEQAMKQEESPEMQEEKPKKLYAIYPILFESHQYKVGEQLPTTNMEMVEAWIEAEAAMWK